MKSDFPVPDKADRRCRKPCRSAQNSTDTRPEEPLRKRLTRIFALLGALFLIGLYVVTLILGLTASENTQKLLMVSIVCTVVIPVLMYAMMLIARVLDSRSSPGKNTGNGQTEQPEEADFQTCGHKNQTTERKN